MPRHGIGLHRGGRGGDATAFLSSGRGRCSERSWAPDHHAAGAELDFTNEGGVCGTTRLLKNIGGLWLLQSCRRSWAAAGRDYDYDELVAPAGERAAVPGAARSRQPRRSGIPTTWSIAIDGYLPPDRAAGARRTAAAYSRAIMESLAFKYRAVLESLEEVTGRRFDEIRVVGGGARNRLLNQFTADATGRTVIAGPVEATALGNIAMQMLATGAVTSLAEARAIIERSFPVERFEPADDRSMGAALPAVPGVRGVDLCLTWPESDESSAEPVGRREAADSCRRSSNCATDRTCSATICASPTSAAATPARSSSCRIR